MILKMENGLDRDELIAQLKQLQFESLVRMMSAALKHYERISISALSSKL